MCTNEIMYESIASKASNKSMGCESILMMRKNYNINDELYVWKELKGREHLERMSKAIVNVARQEHYHQRKIANEIFEYYGQKVLEQQSTRSRYVITTSNTHHPRKKNKKNTIYGIQTKGL